MYLTEDNTTKMQRQSRRNMLRNLAALGGASMIVHPRDLMAITPAESYPALSNGMVRLSSNENPYSPSEKMKEAIQNSYVDLCRYPNARFAEVEKLIAEREGVDPTNVVITSGSREGLKAAGLVYGKNGGEILTCLPTYRALLTYAEKFGAYINVVPLDENLQFNLPELQKRISANTNLVFVCNPNNPTGRLLDSEKLKTFVRKASERTMVFVDEVYFDYIEEEGYPSMSSMINEGHNVIISRTFSKIFGLAGVRVGFLMARADIAKRLRDRLMSGTNIMGVNLAKAALDDDTFRSFSLEKNREGKQMIYASLDKLGMRYLPSHSNFVFFQTGQPIEEVQKKFKDEGIFVGRPFPPFLDWCRISTGKVEEVAAFTKALEKVFS